ncbi:hypothetical protein GCM10025867_46510 (plasmid) [Frondihabitans sucicola]|uniref:Uncharacterized protein n=1 Tax=Frondihabitans sucicola TaxID=1268041 RepID=A0ABN6Y910_9MICO|nr:hypothetical protein [Frondihabitans sucicola]BDZ52410.1 hypothetical protein GCM10025867_46510 [Frondihabitans sucicola]
MSALDGFIGDGLATPQQPTRHQRIAAAAAPLAKLLADVDGALRARGIPVTPSYEIEDRYHGDFTPTEYIRHPKPGVWPLQVFALAEEGGLVHYELPLAATVGDYRAEVQRRTPVTVGIIEDGPAGSDTIVATLDGQLRLLPTHRRLPGFQGRTISPGLAAKFPPGTEQQPTSYPLDEVLGHAIADLVRFYA